MLTLVVSEESSPAVHRQEASHTHTLAGFQQMFSELALINVAGTHRARMLLIMAALWNRAGHYISVLCCNSSSSSFPCLFSAVGDCMSTILQHNTWCGLSVNLECRSETRCTRLAENTGRKKSSKIRHLHHRTICTIAQLCPTVPSQLRHVSTIEKKLVKQQYLIISTGFTCWLRYCTNVTQRTSAKLCTMFRRLLTCAGHYIYIFGCSCP